MSALAPTLQAFFTERLIGQRQASPHAITAYRDTFRLLLVYTQQRTGIAPHRLDFEDLDATLIGPFLDHLEHDRGNSPRTRNHLLAATSRSTITPRCAIPSTRPRSRGCWRSRPSDTTAGSSTTSPSRKRRRFSLRPIAAAGSAAAITH
jgi:hypothetical protein